MRISEAAYQKLACRNKRELSVRKNDSKPNRAIEAAHENESALRLPAKSAKTLFLDTRIRVSVRR